MNDGTNDLSRIVSLIMESKVSVTASAVTEERDNRRNARSQLLCALKPYVSKERAGAIDSMISIAEILEVMRAR